MDIKSSISLTPSTNPSALADKMVKADQPPPPSIISDKAREALKEALKNGPPAVVYHPSDDVPVDPPVVIYSESGSVPQPPVTRG
ncbi:hypothetical protein HX870_27370 [Pseudomonas gingeri]|uniref:Uncharacterized protein n=1 Tax=Pseudomonas gingeri TaxID=117681 RepID=A0A7Y7XH18_9PSED|nr:hypothetical protein [Pseudomonas gingeri]NWB98653.1 hypothetical protein [Pseudomonas gingeri]NWD71326.1 hypothetical protein [Pseudomonas gingeri]NWD72773.1 hypothetical protein [Pseudomonas gingeri]